MTKPRAQQGR